MENNYKISWFKVSIIVIAFIIVAIAVCLLIPKDNKNVVNANTYASNINMMKEAGFEYFRETNLPESVGDSLEISLEKMLDTKLIVDFTDENGKACDIKNSYIKVTKTLDREYAMKVSLTCEEKSDYIVTSIVQGKCVECENNNNDNNSNPSTNTSKEENNNFQDNKPIENTNKNTITYVDRVPSVSTITNVNINYVNSNNCGSNCSNCGSNCLSNVYYTVYFDSQGGDYVPRKVIKQYDTIPYVTTKKDGYEFEGWYLNGSLYNFNTPVTKSITLIAKWKKIDNTPVEANKHAVYFNSNGGSYVKSQTIIHGNYATVPANPTRECYNFGGWYTDSSLTTKYNFNTPVTRDITLYAKWINNGTCNTHTVAFVPNGGDVSIPSLKVKNGGYATRPSDPTHSCFDFVGWYSDYNLTKPYNFNTPVTRDITLYGKWEDRGKCTKNYTVTFNSNGGTYVSGPKTVKEGNYVSMPSNPTRSGYTFIGWYYNGYEFNFNTRIYHNYELVAMWEKESVKYNKYCSINNKTYYSTNYVNANESVWEKNWTIKFDDLYNARNLKITNIGYINSNSMYNKVYQDFARKNISMVNGTGGKYTVPLTSGDMLRNYSLKSSNFNKYLGRPYLSGNTWYVGASISIKNFNNVSKYYASNLGYYIYFTPFYFDVEYTDMNNCVNDLASKSYYYSNYEIVDSFYR